MKSPTQQTLKLMRDRGYTCEVTERWCPFSKRRKDLFGFIDVLCIRGNETVAVQTTTAGHAQERLRKINNTPGAGIWLLSSTRTILLHGWSKKGPRGKRKKWHCNEAELIVGMSGTGFYGVPYIDKSKPPANIAEIRIEQV